jgi:hypothetical protein
MCTNLTAGFAEAPRAWPSGTIAPRSCSAAACTAASVARAQRASSSTAAASLRAVRVHGTCSPIAWGTRREWFGLDTERVPKLAAVFAAERSPVMHCSSSKLTACRHGHGLLHMRPCSLANYYGTPVRAAATSCLDAKLPLSTSNVRSPCGVMRQERRSAAVTAGVGPQGASQSAAHARKKSVDWQAFQRCRVTCSGPHRAAETPVSSCHSSTQTRRAAGSGGSAGLPSTPQSAHASGAVASPYACSRAARPCIRSGCASLRLPASLHHNDSRLLRLHVAKTAVRPTVAAWQGLEHWVLAQRVVWDRQVRTPRPDGHAAGSPERGAPLHAPEWPPWAAAWPEAQARAAPPL